jgi:hypothetical protein
MYALFTTFRISASSLMLYYNWPNAVIFDPPTSLIQWETVSGVSMDTDILYSTAISHCMSITIARKGPGQTKQHNTIPCAQKICNGQINTLPEGADSKH